MSDYSLAFISNEAVTRSYANEFLTEKWLGSFKVASSINSKKLENQFQVISLFNCTIPQ